MTKENTQKMSHLLICLKRLLTFCSKKRRKYLKMKSRYFNLRLLWRYSVISMDNIVISFICLRRWPIRTSRTSKIKFWVETSSTSFLETMSTEASKVARSSAFYLLSKCASPSRSLCSEETMRAKPSREFMDFSTKLKEDTNCHFGRHSTIVSIICL